MKAVKLIKTSQLSFIYRLATTEIASLFVLYLPPFRRIPLRQMPDKEIITFVFPEVFAHRVMRAGYHYQLMPPLRSMATKNKPNLCTFISLIYYCTSHSNKPDECFSGCMISSFTAFVFTGSKFTWFPVPFSVPYLSVPVTGFH